MQQELNQPTVTNNNSADQTTGNPQAYNSQSLQGTRSVQQSTGQVLGTSGIDLFSTSGTTLQVIVPQPQVQRQTAPLDDPGKETAQNAGLNFQKISGITLTVVIIFSILIVLARVFKGHPRNPFFNSE